MWKHLELGAGNYGNEGITKSSQTLTVLNKMSRVSHKENYIDRLPDSACTTNGNKDHQFFVLAWTLERLVLQRGNAGVFIINDIDPEYASDALEYLQTHLDKKKLSNVTLDVIVGDYNAISPLNSLQQYGADKFDSIHLKNPEVSLFRDGMDGDVFSTSKPKREQTRFELKRLAAFSNDGLYLFILDYKDAYFPADELETSYGQDPFYRHQTLWPPVPYCRPDGGQTDREFGKVYHIAST
ncbi:MAG: hypothetical protein AAGA63_09200 [Pseudomonadota bacterium]